MPQKQWTIFSNHGHVLVCLVRNPEAKLRDIAVDVGITERAVQRIIAELEDSEVIKRSRIGRRNHYDIDLDKPLRHPLEDHQTLASVMTVIAHKPDHDNESS